MTSHVHSHTDAWRRRPAWSCGCRCIQPVSSAFRPAIQPVSSAFHPARPVPTTKSHDYAARDETLNRWMGTARIATVTVSTGGADLDVRAGAASDPRAAHALGDLDERPGARGTGWARSKWLMNDELYRVACQGGTLPWEQSMGQGQGPRGRAACVTGPGAPTLPPRQSRPHRG